MNQEIDRKEEYMKKQKELEEYEKGQKKRKEPQQDRTQENTMDPKTPGSPELKNSMKVQVVSKKR